MVRTPKYIERRNEILDTAEMFFVSKGYEKTTVDSILRTLDIAKGTFYHYFKSKEEVLEAIVLRFVEKGVAIIKEIADDPKLGAHQKFKKIMTYDYSVLTHQRFIAEMQSVENALMHQKNIIEIVLRLAPIMGNIVKQGIKEGVFDTPYPEESMEFLLLLSQMSFENSIFGWDKKEMLHKAKVYAYFLERTLGAEKGSFSYAYKKFQ
ncbi:AcrR family transcriptional regulator [Elusimicrobium posterum]|uniref:TetR/AcrR family transcriptional regulator n=1 Tax=Elusimicrobium posterum TaxID=3116653 RepID=UPI003C75BE56